MLCVKIDQALTFASNDNKFQGLCLTNNRGRTETFKKFGKYKIYQNLKTDNHQRGLGQRNFQLFLTNQWLFHYPEIGLYCPKHWAKMYVLQTQYC